METRRRSQRHKGGAPVYGTDQEPMSMKPPDDDRKGPLYRAEISRVADVVGAAAAAGRLQRRDGMNAKIKRTTLAIKLTELEIARTTLAIRKTDLQMARVSLASKKTERRTGRVKLAIARVGLVAAIVGVVGGVVVLLVRLQVVDHPPRNVHADPAADERSVAAPAKEPKAAGMRDIRWHDLRHSFASNLIAAGVPILQVQAWMGHSTIAMTMRYAHLAPQTNNHMITVLDEAPTEKKVALVG
jgi:hypothetical protein